MTVYTNKVLGDLYDINVGASPEGGGGLLRDSANSQWKSSYRAWNTGETVTDGFILGTTTDATAETQQYSPAFIQGGEGWKSNATAESQLHEWCSYVKTASGAAASSSSLVWAWRFKGGSWQSQMEIGGTVTEMYNHLDVTGYGNFSSYLLCNGLFYCDADTVTASNGYLVLGKDTLDPGSTGGTIGNVPTGYDGGSCDKWLIIGIDTTKYAIPLFQETP